jgi:hypothetical protein
VRLLAHAVSRAKWEKKPSSSDEEIPADAVTTDLRTHENDLSFWEFGDDEEQRWDEAALAITSKRERLDSVDLAWIERDAVAAAGISLVGTPGNTPVADLKRRHTDARQLDAYRLIDIAELIFKEMRSGGRVRRLSTAQVRGLITNAINGNRVDPADLSPKLRADLDTSGR